MRHPHTINSLNLLYLLNGFSSIPSPYKYVFVKAYNKRFRPYKLPTGAWSRYDFRSQNIEIYTPDEKKSYCISSGI